ncbi:MAG TPA: 2-oxoacid:acceptor oxidoreductase subunit alpha [bacterium (Candidatus Stahlbacteria)]|nr:2-oxoacid:acceptor oxidoreductase subunit alpha [Candidatus Stahlbacteria bacterium]
MKANPKDTLTGTHYVDGDVACAEGALAAGCKFFGGYPITPSTEVAERISERFPMVGGIFIQMEDELASMAAILGASWAGVKSMTVTSGPGFSLMQENIGLGVMLETPTVVVNVQRGGPSTGLPTLPGQADVMQARWGSHGDYEIIALAPSTVQECFDFTIKCFNLAEKYRVPVILLMDECVGHMTEKLVIPPAEEIELIPRRYYNGPKHEYLPFKRGPDYIPYGVKAGDGYRIHITGLTHDERGYPVINAEAQKKNVEWLLNKIRKNAPDIYEFEAHDIDGADVVVLSYGISSRVTVPSIEMAKKDGIKVGTIRLITVWPFPEDYIRKLASKVETIVVVEMNYGQIYLEVERCVKGQCEVRLVPHAGGWVHDPKDIYNAITEYHER